MGNRIYFKIAGYVDLDMLHIFAIKLNIYLYSFWFDPIWAETHDLPHFEASTLTITPPMRLNETTVH
jgi:hypothetical protein